MTDEQFKELAGNAMSRHTSLVCFCLWEWDVVPSRLFLREWDVVPSQAGTPKGTPDFRLAPIGGAGPSVVLSAPFA